ncbi:uncharacterized protein LOC130430545 [Triplophysa dalaica]|uniref:uncharacterized protein LOC130430545 n=1 Tax=Triplophysa dalaica TaxID=1582913 RepID=UPI0024DFD1E1|nr:uncharacterized protein LOC130430545 [Triplophysa dalaica]
MIRSVIVLPWLLRLLPGMSSEEIPSPEVTRDYQSSTDPKQCVILCLVPIVTQANLLWINGSVLYSSLMITDLNTKLYLVVDYQDKNNYSCVVSSSGFNQTAHLNISRICQPCRDENLTVSTSEGDSVTLPTNLTQVLFYDHIEWIHKNACIAELCESLPIYRDCDNCGLNNRLQLDNKTGSLTITNLSKIHSGLYKLKITNAPLNKCLTKSYFVNVYDPLPKPVITKNSTRCSSSSKCVVMCSVNVTGGTLSWYNGSRLNSSISVSDLKRSNFLCLEVEDQDTNTYSCVVNNSFTNKTTLLHINVLCKDNSQKITNIVIGVLVSVLAASIIAFLIWRSRRSQEGASGSQAQANAAPAQIAGASGHHPSDNTSNSGVPLIGQPSSSQSQETPLIQTAANNIEQ